MKKLLSVLVVSALVAGVVEQAKKRFWRCFRILTMRRRSLGYGGSVGQWKVRLRTLC